VQLADEIWVLHAFEKKSTQGIRTPKCEADRPETRKSSGLKPAVLHYVE
jgi:hypothetical protein